MRFRWLIILAALACVGAAPPPGPREADYTVSPEFQGGALTALDVTVRLRASAEGKTVLRLPDMDSGVSGLWRYVQNLRVEGARTVVEDGPARRIVTSAQAAPLVARYRLVSAFDHDPISHELDTYKPTIRPGWFWAYGEALFVIPDGATRARFAWAGAPKDFPFASNLEHAGGRDMPIDKLVESVSVGGPDLTVLDRRVAGGLVRVAVIGRYGFDATAFADLTERVISGERGFWGTAEGPFLVTLAPITPEPQHVSTRGEGRGDSIAVMTTTNVPLNDMREMLAHEYFHTWNSARLGGTTLGAREADDYWFSEGFTDYYARRLLLRMGVFSLEDFAADWNQMLRAYAVSPVRTAPADRVKKDFWNDFDVQALPYQRGAILAAMAEQRLRATSNGRIGIDDVMRAMLARAGEPHSPLAPELFLRTMRTFGVEMRTDVRDIADNGATASLPADAFGGCLRVQDATEPVFDRGFDRDASDRAGVIVGVKPQSNAYAAGLRDGMAVVKVEAGFIVYSVRVRDPGGERVISYRPTATLSLQKVTVPPDLTPERRAQCTREAAGGAPTRVN